MLWETTEDIQKEDGARCSHQPGSGCQCSGTQHQKENPGGPGRQQGDNSGIRKKESNPTHDQGRGRGHEWWEAFQGSDTPHYPTDHQHKSPLPPTQIGFKTHEYRNHFRV